MTPKDKAKELVDKIYKSLTTGFAENDYAQILAHNMWFKEAKQCALICVDEILNIIDIANKEYDLGLKGFQLKQEIYWQEVKQEIEKL